jgi:carboxyl-terminal processing protease
VGLARAGRYHYKATPLDDAMSEKIFDRYFKSLDSEKMFFTQADIDQFAPCAPASTTPSTAKPERAVRDLQSLPAALQRPHGLCARTAEDQADFSSDETYQYDREKADPGPRTRPRSSDLWRKRVKNDWLRLKLAGKDDKSIRETLDKRYEGYLSRIAQAEQRRRVPDVHERLRDVDRAAHQLPGPARRRELRHRHAPVAGRHRRVLQSREDYTVIREVVTGSPADKSGKIKVGDRIVGVAKGKADSPTCWAGASTTWSS